MNNIYIRSFVFFFILLTAISCTKVQTYVNDVADYKISGPPNWYMRQEKDYSVKFTKFNKDTPGNSSIVVTVELLNPNILTPKFYIESFFLPKLREELKKTSVDMNVTMITEPCMVDRNGYEWAMAKYYVRADIIQTIFVNFSEKNMFAISLTSFKADFPREEKLFFTTLDSFQYVN